MKTTINIKRNRKMSQCSVLAVLAAMTYMVGTEPTLAAATTKTKTTTPTSTATTTNTTTTTQGQPPLLPNGQLPPKQGNGTMPPAMPNGGQPGMTPPPGGQQNTVSSDTFKATKLVNGKTEKINAKTIDNKTSDQNTVLVKNNGVLTITNSTISKTGDTTNNDGSNFNGQNAVVLALGGDVSDGKTTSAKISIKDTTITSNSEGSNAVFATGKGAEIEVENIKIHTKSNSSRGLDATYNGVVKGKNVEITTEGEHSASLATDRGEGTIIVENAKLKTSGAGSPVIYSTGDIRLNKGVGVSTGSEIGAVEGKNSITVTNSDLTGYVDNGFMLYQSFSGDAESGIAKLKVSDSKLTTHAPGAFIYVNNTVAEADLTNNEIIMDKTNTLIKAASDSRWGVDGQNGGHLTFVASNQKLNGNVVVDKNSTVDITLKDKSTLTGAINTEKTGQKVALHLTKDSIWNVTGDSYLTEFTNEDSTNSNVKTNGHKVEFGTTNKK